MLRFELLTSMPAAKRDARWGRQFGVQAQSYFVCPHHHLFATFRISSPSFAKLMIYYQPNHTNHASPPQIMVSGTAVLYLEAVCNIRSIDYINMILISSAQTEPFSAFVSCTGILFMCTARTTSHVDIVQQVSRNPASTTLLTSPIRNNPQNVAGTAEATTCIHP